VINPNSRRTFGPPLAGLLLAGCAIPSTQVSVPTESMRDALQQARSAHRAEPVNEMPLPRRPARLAAPPGAPQPMVAPPDVRMAYLYEWVDAEGNKHFGGWVAIPLSGFDWVMTDGSTAQMGLPSPNTTESGPQR
jgi:hypothetical protein